MALQKTDLSREPTELEAKIMTNEFGWTYDENSVGDIQLSTVKTLGIPRSHDGENMVVVATPQLGFPTAQHMLLGTPEINNFQEIFNRQ